jgi:hypothetical protein
MLRAVVTKQNRYFTGHELTGLMTTTTQSYIYNKY